MARAKTVTCVNGALDAYDPLSRSPWFWAEDKFQTARKLYARTQLITGPTTELLTTW